MKRKIEFRTFSTVLALFLASSLAYSQMVVRDNTGPLTSVRAKVAGAHIMINYKRLNAHGKMVWGNIVPYNKYWTAGVNGPTVFSTDRDIRINGKKLPAGSYSLYVKPGEKSWDIIFNSNIYMAGKNKNPEMKPNPANNVLMVSVKPIKNKKYHNTLSYNIEKHGFDLEWAHDNVPLMIKEA